MGSSKDWILGTDDRAPKRTPGSWGTNDHGDPNARRPGYGDTPGSTGVNDGGDPDAGAPGGSICTTTEVRFRFDDSGPTGKDRDEPYEPAGLTIRGNDDFIEATRRHLEEIRHTKCGALLLNKLKAVSNLSGKGKVRILSEDAGRSASALSKPDAYPKGVRVEAWLDENRKDRTCFVGTGEGSDVIVRHNHTLFREENGQRIPHAIGLAHELVHAWHQAEGTLATGWSDNVWNYERQSVGLGSYFKCGKGCSGEVTENCIRAQWTPKIKRREQYGGEQKGIEPTL